MLTEKEAAALTRLEQERERRINEKIESGAAVRVLLPIVAGARESVDADRARNRKLEELRRNGETREVYFDEVVIIRRPTPGARARQLYHAQRERAARGQEMMLRNKIHGFVSILAPLHLPALSYSKRSRPRERRNLSLTDGVEKVVDDLTKPFRLSILGLLAS